jgi:hypothetical protein
MSEQYPTREQIAKAFSQVRSTTEALRHMPILEAGSGVPDVRFNLNVVTEHFNAIFTAVDGLDAVLALFPQPTPSADPMRDYAVRQFLALATCPDDQSRLDRLAQALDVARSAGMVLEPTTPAEPPSIADMAPGTTFWAQFRDTDRRALFVKIGGTTAWPVMDVAAGALAVYSASALDPSTIRNVNPPKDAA